MNVTQFVALVVKAQEDNYTSIMSGGPGANPVLVGVEALSMLPESEWENAFVALRSALARDWPVSQNRLPDAIWYRAGFPRPFTVK